MEYIVDMMGFKQSENDYILKEIAIVPLIYDEEPLVRLFKSPFPCRKLTDTLQRENIWLKQNYHGISWNTNGINYCEIGNFLRSAFKDATKIYVMGDLEKKWLQRFGFPVDDINYHGYQSKNSFKCVTICTNHNASYKVRCALHNVKLMKLYLQSINKTK